MKIIENQTFDAERALYGSKGLEVVGCSFSGPVDGESALKEATDIKIKVCYFNLRYPFWHDNHLSIAASEMTELCRAALWYSNDIKIVDSKLHGVKALRECSDVTISGCDIVSPEFGWSTRGMRMEDSTVAGEYFMLRSEKLDLHRVNFKGKYSFQYVEGALMEDCVFDTKDAFWHTKNVTVRNSAIKGEYLAWYSDGLTLENCRIEGTQPFCYCTGLKLINCEMVGCDLAFEKSEVDATIVNTVMSIKNPKKGIIRLPGADEIIMDDENAHGEIVIIK